jgi:acetyltransferase-like isoleucine patch superfamily enzyme
LIQKLINGLSEFRARRKLSGCNGLVAHASARIAFRRIRFRSGCNIQIGEGSIVEGQLVCERDGARIVIGRNSFIGDSLIASADRIEVGDDVLISWGCNIVDHNSHSLKWTERKQDVKDWYQGKKDWAGVSVRPVKIGNKAWLGLNVTILKGVEIGEGAVVGAGSVVIKSVPPWTIVAGNPATMVREIPIEDR